MTEEEGHAFQPDFMQIILDLIDHESRKFVFSNCVGIHSLLVARAIYELDGLCALTMVSSRDRTIMLPFVPHYRTRAINSTPFQCRKPTFENRETIWW
jgi:hypothetical protein